MNYLRSISLFRPVILSVLICILITLSILKFFTISSAYATAISSKDSQVFIAVDITAQTRCLHKLIRYVGTSHQEIVVHSCSAGSILKSQITGLSQALAQHKKYVKLPTSQASRTTWEQTDRQIENLLENEAQKVQLPGASVQLSPQQRCGYSGSSYFQYTIDGDGPIGEEIDYYVSINCQMLHWIHRVSMVGRVDLQMHCGGITISMQVFDLTQVVNLLERVIEVLQLQTMGRSLLVINISIGIKIMHVAPSEEIFTIQMNLLTRDFCSNVIQLSS